MDDTFLLPGIFDPLLGADEASLHQGGLDYASLRNSDPDIFGNDQTIGPDGPEDWKREHLPQFGPPFVGYVHDRFSKIDAYMERLLARWSYEPVTVVIFASMNADANGNINRSVNDKSILYEPPPGFTLALHRLTIGMATSNFGTPFNAATAYWELRVNDEMLDGASLEAPAVGKVGGSFPVVRTWGTRDALRVRDGEVLSLFVSGTGTLAGKTLTVRGQGTLDRVAEG